MFENLLVSGHVPDIAIFIDGLNEFFYFQDKPFFTPFLEAFMNGDYGRTENASYGNIDKLPVTRAARFIQKVLLSKERILETWPAGTINYTKRVRRKPGAICKRSY